MKRKKVLKKLHVVGITKKIVKFTFCTFFIRVCNDNLSSTFCRFVSAALHGENFTEIDWYRNIQQALKDGRIFRFIMGRKLWKIAIFTIFDRL